MKAEDIIEGLNLYIEEKRKDKGIKTTGHLVLQKQIIPHSSFKAYKVYKYTLWFVKGHKSYEVIIMQHTAKVTDGQEEGMNREMNIMLSKMIFNWIGSNFYEEIINGDYKGYVPEDRNE